MSSTTNLINGCIYKISSIDNKMNYYGLTIQNIEIRYQQHIIKYNTYKSNHEKSQFCSSFIIFDTYTPLNTSIHIVEEHNNITLIQLRNREKYYIHNFDCVNILAKNNYLINSDFLTLEKTHITQQMIFENQPIIHSITPNIIHIIQLLGYNINHDNTLILQSQTSFFAIKKHLLNILQTYYPHFKINNRTSSILNTINLILNQHNLQVITHEHIIYKHRHKFVFTKLLIYPYNINTAHSQIVQNN